MFTYFGQQVELSFFASLLAIALAVALRAGLMALGRPAQARTAMWSVLTLGTVAVIGIFTVAPIGIRNHVDRALVLIPFGGGEYSNVNSQLIIEKIVYNIALFVPLGFCSRAGLLRRLAPCAAAGFAVSLVVETTQYVSARGTSTTTDLLLNTLGAIAGAALAVFFLATRCRTW